MASNGLDSGDSIRPNDKMRFFRGWNTDQSPGERNVPYTALVEFLNDPANGLSAGASFTDVETAVDYTIPDGSSYRILVDTSLAPVSIALSSGAADQIVEVVDAAGNAGTNIITIVGSIDGGANVTIEANNGAYQVSYIGSSWETSGGFNNYFKRNASTGEISTREPDSLIADGMQAASGTSVISDQSVADGDYTNVGVAVETSVPNEYSNKTAPDTGTDYLVYGQTVVTSQYGSLNPVDNPLNDARARWDDLAGSVVVTFDLGVGNEVAANVFRLVKGGDLGNDVSFEYTVDTIEGSLDGASWDTVGSGFPSFSGTGTLDHTFSNETVYRYYRLNITGQGTDVAYCDGISLYKNVAVTTNNTFDTQLASGSAGAFAAGSLKVYDEADTLVTGSGKVNVDYRIDGGGWNTLIDQDTFKALGDLAYSASFDLQFQLVGDQKFSRATIGTAVVRSLVNQSGLVVEQGGVEHTTLGDVFKMPKKTTAERDALSPAEGWAIYNSTTNKINFYNGSAWEVVTSS